MNARCLISLRSGGLTIRIILYKKITYIHSRSFKLFIVLTKTHFQLNYFIKPLITIILIIIHFIFVSPFFLKIYSRKHSYHYIDNFRHSFHHSVVLKIVVVITAAVTIVVVNHFDYNLYYSVLSWSSSNY